MTSRRKHGVYSPQTLEGPPRPARRRAPATSCIEAQSASAKEGLIETGADWRCKEGGEFQGLMHAADWLPTLLDMVGAPVQLGLGPGVVPRGYPYPWCGVCEVPSLTGLKTLPY